MAIIFILLFILLLIVITFLWVRHCIFMSKITWHFRKSNIIIFGYKSTGKDLITNYFVNKLNEPYYANMSYTEGTKKDDYYMEITLKELSLEPNTPMDFINGNVTKTEHKFMESCNVYISDIHVHAPNYLDSKLYVKYPSLPVFYPLSSQLYDMNIIFNGQDLERGWKALREQADYFICCKRTFKIFGLLLTKIYGYEKYETAKKRMLPIKTRFFNKYSKAEVDVYRATNGEILEGFVIQTTRNVHYDTRHFEKVALEGDRILNPKHKKSRR